MAVQLGCDQVTHGLMVVRDMFSEGIKEDIERLLDFAGGKAGKYSGYG